MVRQQRMRPFVFSGVYRNPVQVGHASHTWANEKIQVLFFSSSMPEGGVPYSSFGKYWTCSGLKGFMKSSACQVWTIKQIFLPELLTFLTRGQWNVSAVKACAVLQKAPDWSGKQDRSCPLFPPLPLAFSSPSTPFTFWDVFHHFTRNAWHRGWSRLFI